MTPLLRQFVYVLSERFLATRLQHFIAYQLALHMFNLWSRFLVNDIDIEFSSAFEWFYVYERIINHKFTLLS